MQPSMNWGGNAAVRQKVAECPLIRVAILYWLVVTSSISSHLIIIE